MVFYRKYRPQTIEELDSEEVKRALETVLSSKTIPHAFLFTGPKGLGKTSTARIVAKYVNCLAKRDLASPDEKVSKVSKVSKEKTKKSFDTSGSSDTSVTIPCNKCEQCVSITKGTNIDVLEIDGASNRGIDEMRDLREKIRLLPASATKKVYIIDEVHMLTTEAFNALLKTLEEPPAHAMFVLCTTEPHKIPGTILSRCFHIPFKKATTQDLIHSFRRIAVEEKLDIDDETLTVIASFADGSFRDGAKVLEEIALSAQGEKITKAFLEKNYHAASIDATATSFLEGLLQKDAKKTLKIVSENAEAGIDTKFFLEKIMLRLHTILMIKTGIEKKTSDALENQIDILTIQSLMRLLTTAYGEIRYAVLPQLPLEIAVVEWVQGSEFRVQNSELKETETKTKFVIARSETTKQSPDSGTSNSAGRQARMTDKEIDSAKEIVFEDKSFLYQLLDSIKGENHMLAGVLRSCKMVQSDAEIIIEAPSNFHKQRLQDKKALDVLEKVCKDITGKEIRVSVILKA